MLTLLFTDLLTIESIVIRFLFQPTWYLDPWDLLGTITRYVNRVITKDPFVKLFSAMSICLFLRRDYLAPYTMADKNSSQNCNFNVAVYLRLTSYFNEILLLTKTVYFRFETFTMNDGFLILWISIVLFVRCAVFRRKLDALRSGSRKWIGIWRNVGTKHSVLITWFESEESQMLQIPYILLIVLLYIIRE